jgi:hypothetical protein
MRPLTLEEIPASEAFEAIRPRLQAAILEHKRPRRVAVGDRVTLLFEDRETLRWQVLEMCRVERTRDPSGVQAELDVYNDLIPGPGELSATLFIEITDAPRIRTDLDALVGIDEHVFLEVGDQRVAARFDEKQLSEDRISAVHYLRFSLTPSQALGFAEPATAVALAIDHPRYRARTVLSPETRRSLSVDLGGDPEPLLDLSALPAVAAGRRTVLRRHGRARAVHPDRPLGPGHVVVEADEPRGSFLEADAALLGDLVALAQEIAREFNATYGGCRIVVDPAADPLRLDVLAPRSA